ncbi:membrane-bound transcription factor site-2 protease homolog isoform X2 [Salvia splendens]|uniref:membrane-bound transcription factor site-2 protease homolog isoform X2 n=1 Tax=Salvia splendens TaxID=180675 RepID=UPI001C25BE0A|nr:membrane-bound transcription factor site-2 protease homolog isoform X2 [Salvia splendens]
MMDGRRGGRRRGDQTLLPLRRPARHFAHTVSCWYCDFKCMAFNELLFRLGRRHSKILRIWFSIGIGFSLAALIGATVVSDVFQHLQPRFSSLKQISLLSYMCYCCLVCLLFSFCKIILCEMAKATLTYAGIARSRDSSFSLSFLTAGMHMSPSSMGFLCLSSFLCVLVHEFGHALAAASEGVQMEYIAIFCALVFPGALVAFNDASLQLLPGLASLRIYCAGIWHNAAVCGVCTLALFLLPFILSPLYIHGESPMVLDVHSTSPLSGYLSPYDVIHSLDEFRVYTADQWKQKLTVLTEQTPPLSFGQSSEMGNMQKSYCVPHSLIEKSIHVPFTRYETYCPNELFAFAPITCPDMSEYRNGGNKTNNQESVETIHCLNAKDVIKLRKCAHDPVQASSDKSGCLCSEDESCFMPVQLPGLGWVEITYSRLECLNHGRSVDSENQQSNSGEKGCIQTFVFVGDLTAMAHSVHLTSYQPRLSMYFIAYLPDLLERFLTCSFHVSMVLALLNSLPVFFLDGESILEVTLLHYFGFMSSRMRQSVLRCCLYVGTAICAFLIMRTIFVSVS